MSVTHTGFHAHDGWYFERQEDGSVKISAAVNQSTETIVLTASEWPSVVAAVCAGGEASDSYQAAVRLHGPGVLVGTMKTCWCGGDIGSREPGDENGQGCLADITHGWPDRKVVATPYTEQETTK